MIVTTSVKYWLNHICSLVTYTALVQHFLWWLALGLIVTHSVCSLGRANQGALMKAATNQQQKLTLAVTSCAFIIIIIIIISEWLIEEYSGPWSEKSTEIKPQRAFFLLFARTMVIQQVFQHQYDAATLHSFNKVVQKHKIPNKRQSKSTNYCHANLSSHTCCNNSYFHPSLAESFTTLKAYACREF